MTLFLCGDVMTGRGVDQILPHPSGPQIFESYVKDAREYVALAEAHNGPISKPVTAAYIWGEALSELARVVPDVRIINLETSVTESDDYWRGKGINYRMHPENIACLTAAHVDVCGLANNHVLDYGYAGLTQTLETLTRAGVKPVGAGRRLAEAQAPAIVTLANATRVIVFAFGTDTSGIPSDWAARDDRPGIDLLPDLSEVTVRRIADRLRQVRRPRDIVVASIHWGSNWAYDVPREHVRFAHWLIDGGIDIVHGHSSHHPRPIEVYRDRLILYGCGDFIDDYEGIEGYEPYRDDLVLMYFATLSPATGELTALQMTPMQIRKMTLNKASRTDTEWMQDSLERVSASYGTHVELGAGGSLSLWWKQPSHPSVSSAGEHAHQKWPASVGNPAAENGPSRDPCGSFLAPSSSIIASPSMSAPSSFATRIEPELMRNGIEVLRARYLKKNDHGQIVETPSEMFSRVARHVAEVERRYAGDPATTADAFYEAMARLEFLPNSPALMNAGTPLGQLAACFVLPIGDSLDSIFGSLRDAALVHQTGGGVGYDFSRLRPKGDVVASTGGGSSGPVSFMEVFDAAVDAVRQGGRRRGANMGVLDVHHPDIEAFVTAKRDPQRLRNFNLSVAVDEAFMTAAAEARPIALVNPRTGETTGSRQADELLQLIATSAWETGDPGLIFLDRINRDNPTPALGLITATNPCGEVPLLPYEACVLGSINLAALTRGGVFDWERFDALIDLGIRFLDDCLDASLFPLPQITTAVHRSRKIGLGVMGFADALIDLGIAYDEEAATRFADRLMERMAARATEASRQLAKSRGPYPDFAQSREGTAGVAPVRNATRLAIAPTGTLSLIAGCSSGIEPLFAVAFERHVLDGRALVEVNARFEALATREGVWSPGLQHKVLESGRVRQLTEVPVAVRRLFPTSHEIPAEHQLRMQAAFQAHVDNAVSKTINLPSDATVSQVLEAYRCAFALGCKGITVYRHGAKVDQVLTTVRKSSVCPDCLSALEFSEGVTLCRACGFSSTS